MPWLSARVPIATHRGGPIGLSEADPEGALLEIRAFESLGVEHIALVFEETDPKKLIAAVERFDSEVVKAVGARLSERS
jgi:hypothetical protein